MKKNILEIQNLHASINNVEILKGLNLSVNEGEIHAIMGPNGSGKSTLSKVIAGHPLYSITEGSVKLNQEDITYCEPEERANKGIFLAFQYPVEIPGVNNIDFLRLAYNEKQKKNNQPELDPLSFFDLINQKAKQVNMNPEFLTRNVNEGFSGGEKKRNEILQMALLDNKLSILDETDSGLDIDALKSISTSINNFFSSQKAIVLITHYQRLLNYIIPDFVHIMQNGKIICTGTAELAKQLEKEGYNNLLKMKNN
uniref:iron-sulfur cluster formation ABC transporter ATP-binding subunit n=1 Tax=Lithothamnion corallioides TaxID=1277934 RepID=UPI0023F065C0|nr:iron-sulfur cluster formation ABC transporter ATP-binding subunit [Lithothamnion corallioides]WEA77100.1 iron-sulfur cluster formation ABC transporter ATP-binding subunit [Lithothamnion corallioides]